MIPPTRFLYTFFTVCEEELFVRAARKLHLTQPAVSYQMKRLEQDLGAELFERAGRRMILTPAGKALHRFCVRYFSELEVLSRRLSEEDLPADEPLRISAVSGFGRYVLFPALTGERFRDLRLDLTYETAEDIFRRVERGEVDLGIVYHSKVSNFLTFHELQQEELLLVAAPDAAAECAAADLTLDDVEAMPFVTYEESDYVFGKWFGFFFGIQPGRLRSVHHFEELEEVVEMVRLGRGGSIVPDGCVAELVQEGSIAVLRPDNKRCTNQVFGVTRAGAYPREGVEAVLDALS